MSFKVADQFRENPLSLSPGGYTIIVTYNNGSQREYDKVKNPAAYIRKLSVNENVKDARIK